MLITPSARAPRRFFAMVASALALAIGFSGVSAMATLDSANAAVGNAMSPLNGFTVLTQDDATLGSAGEFEGSLAAGGDVSFTNYNLNANKDGSALPAVDGLSDVQLFVGGTVTISGAANKLDVNAGRTRVTDTSGLTITNGVRLGKAGVSGYVLTQGAYSQNTIAGTGASSYTATANGYSTAFPASTFTTLATSSTSYAALTAGSEVVLVGPATSGGELGLTLTAGKVNVWNVSSTVFNGQTALNLNGAMPSETTRLIINVTDGNSGKLNAIRINSVDPRYVLWNFPGWTTLKVQGNAKFSGSILAPLADVTYSNGSDFNGQIAAKSFTVDTAAEIHHYGYTTPENTTVAGSWSTTTACESPSNQLVVDAVAGVTYTWTAGGTGDFTSFSQKDLTGTYSFTVSVTDPAKYTLGTNPTSFSVTFTAPKDCDPPSSKCITPDLVKYTYSEATNSGTVTVTNPDGYNGVLCTPFWVTAVAWKYTTTAVWPQALDIENPMSNNEGGTQITKAGTYTYGAPVGCGQGDIYASFVSQKQTSPTLSGVSQLDEPQKPFAEHFLHEMGFKGPTPTYSQSPAGCNKATPVAPTATPIQVCDTYGSVVVGTGKTAVALTALSPTATVAGVVYTLASGSNGTFGTWEVTATPATNRYFDGPQKVVYSGDLKARTVCTESVEPEIEVATCDSSNGTINSAYIVIPSTPGLIYSVDGTAYEAKDVVKLSTGAHKVTVAEKTGYTNTGKEEFTLDVKAYPGACVAPTVVTGEARATAQTCDANYVVQQGSVLAIAHTGVKYELWNQAKSASIATLTAGTPRPTANGTYYVKVIPIDTSYKVLAADEWILVTVDPSTGICAPTDVAGSAKTAGETCSATDYTSTKTADYTVALGSVTANSAKGVTYELWNQAKTSRIAVLTADDDYDIAGGTYFVKVLPESTAYSVSTANEWIQVDVPKNSKICEVIGDPTAFQECVANPLDPTTSDWTSHLTIAAADHVQHRVYFKDGVTWDDQGIWAAGQYDAGTAKLPYDTIVLVVAESESGWSLLAPKDWKFTITEASVCDLPTGGTVTPVVTFAQTCEAGASYALSIEGGVQGTVLWSVNGGPQTTQLGKFAASAPSKVTIVATPAPGSGFDGNGLPRTFEKTFTDAASCDLETLAFTGQNVTGYLVIAVILFQAGLALVAVQFIRARRRARHLAA